MGTRVVGLTTTTTVGVCGIEACTDVDRLLAAWVVEGAATTDVEVCGTGVRDAAVDATTLLVEAGVVLTAASRITLVDVNCITGEAYAGDP